MHLKLPCQKLCEELSCKASINSDKQLRYNTTCNAPNMGEGELSRPTLLKRLNTKSNFTTFLDDPKDKIHESVGKLLKPLTSAKSPMTLWLYMNSRDRADFLAEMKLLIVYLNE